MPPKAPAQTTDNIVNNNIIRTNNIAAPTINPDNSQKVVSFAELFTLEEQELLQANFAGNTGNTTL